jgi:hypothetical protein
MHWCLSLIAPLTDPLFALRRLSPLSILVPFLWQKNQRAITLTSSVLNVMVLPC